MDKKALPEVVIYQGKNGAIELKGDISHETIWASQAQIVELFGVDRTVITKHINNILKNDEVDEKSNVQKMHIAHADRPVKFYSLDIILAVGYRTNSKVAIAFRKWATQTLKQYITTGFVVDKKRIQKNYDVFMQMLSDMKLLSSNAAELKSVDTLQLIEVFASTWFSLDAYDKGLQVPAVTKKDIAITAADLWNELKKFKKQLISKAEATDLFAMERSKESLEGILGNIFQSFARQDVYESVEEKAANLLYLVVKNHPFVDGNKRSGAYIFIWFLQKAGILNMQRITPQTLTTLTLLVAQSAPADKDKIVHLIMLLLGKE